MITVFRKLRDLLEPWERRRFLLLLSMMLVMGILETIGIASILPFMAVLSRPSMIETNSYLTWLYETFDFTSPENFLIFLGVGVFCLIVFGQIFKAFTQYATYRFTFMRGYHLSQRVLRGYLFHPYTWFLNRHSADLGASVLTEVNQVVNGALMAAMKMLSQIIVVLMLVGLLFAIRPLTTLVVTLTVSGSYGLIYLLVSRYLGRIGRDRQKANEERFQIAGEALGGIKDVKLLGLEEAFLHRFKDPARRVAVANSANNTIAEVPRYVLEAVAFGGILLFILFLLVTGAGTLDTVLPLLVLYAFAGVRMFPALQRIYVSFTALRFNKAPLDKLHAEMIESRDVLPRPGSLRPAEPLRLRERLEIDGVHYGYPQAERAALSGLTLTIDARTTVGIVGGTGAGKTTAVDLILGLLPPERGVLRVDGVEVGPANLRAWQRPIGYVPQQIFLVDSSISANIAFGLDPSQIDQVAVERAARIAELHDFVTSELPQGYDTMVGERGVRLSGGQRQRIGIARALYHDPDVLILDEATSALDNLTERAVMDAVQNLGHAKTIILIAHRLSTVKECDMIFMMEQGRLVASGRYDDLLDSSQKFRAMAAGAA